MSLWKRCAHRGRQRDACDHPWWSVIRVHGRRVQESLEQYFGQSVRGRGSKTLAAALDRRLRDDVLSGVYHDKRSQAEALNIPKGGLTFDALIPLYRTGYAELRGLRSWDGDRRWKLEKVRRAWTGRRLSEIRLVHVQTFLAGLKHDGARPSTVRRYYALLHHLFGWAATNGCLDASPITKGAIQLEQEDNERSRRLHPDEETRLFAAASPYLSDILTVALDTGLRMGTIRQMQVAHVDWSKGHLNGATARHHGLLRLPARTLKSKRPLVIPMTARVREVLERRAIAIEQAPDGYLFGNEIGEAYKSNTPIRKDWIAALAKAGITYPADQDQGIEARDGDLHFHDLRGEAASRLLEMGIPIDAIRRFLGHGSLAMTQRYLRARVGEADELVAALEQWVPLMDRQRGESTKTSTVEIFGRRAR